VRLFDFAANEAVMLAVDDDTETGLESNASYRLEPFANEIAQLQQGQMIVWEEPQPRGENSQALSAVEGIGPFIGTPLISQDELIGILTLSAKTSETRFSQEHQAIARQVADQLAIAIQQTRLHEQIQRRVDELIFLERVGRTVTSSLDLEQILATVMEETAYVLETAACSISLLDEESGELVFRAAVGPHSDKIKGLRLPVGQGIAGWVVREGQSLLMPDVRQDARFYPSIDATTCFVTRSALAVPLQVKDKAIGAIQALNKIRGNFSQADVKLLSSIAQWAAIAIENVRLMEQTSEIQVLQELNRLRSELIANVSHELRTPLGLIKIFATSLLRERTSFDDETRWKFLHGIRDETDKLEEIVDNLLDLARLDSERLRLDKRPTDLGELTRRVMESMQAQFVDHRFVHDFIPLVARVDTQRIEQVLRNLLINAIKYSPEGGTITAQVYWDDGDALIAVSDEGIGIHPQEQQRIFERFYRVDNEVTRRVRGAGLGLSVCRGIMEAHQGRIWVESAPGEGSTFYCRLPVGDQENERQQ
jgi:two-component system sensor histidine kinase KdpD